MQTLMTYWPALVLAGSALVGWGSFVAAAKFAAAKQSDHSDEIDELTSTVVDLSATVRVLQSQVGDLRTAVRDLTQQLRERPS